MKISTIVEFLEGVRKDCGDIEVESITGFWINTVPMSGEKIVVPSVGDSKSISDILSGRVSLAEARMIQDVPKEVVRGGH